MRFIKLFIVVILLLNSCQKSDKNLQLNQDTLKNKTQIAFDKAKQVLYSLPSPVETAMIIENTQTKFSDEYILPLDYINKYETTYAKAIILGVYIADLSYASIFEQQNLAVKYLSNCKKLAEQLGILEIISDSIINELSENIKKKEEVLEIISDQYMKISSFLDENNRQQLATLMVFGGWIEGLYISTRLVNNDVRLNPDLVQTIYDQRLSLLDLIGLMGIYEENEYINKYLQELKSLEQIFSSITSPVSQEEFDMIQIKTNKIRNQIISIK